MGYRRFRRPLPFVARRWLLADVCNPIMFTKKNEPSTGRLFDSGFGIPRFRDSELSEDGRRAAIDDQRTAIVVRRLSLADVKPPLCLLTLLTLLTLPTLLTRAQRFILK